MPKNEVVIHETRQESQDYRNWNLGYRKDHCGGSKFEDSIVPVYQSRQALRPIVKRSENWEDHRTRIQDN